MLYECKEDKEQVLEGLGATTINWVANAGDASFRSVGNLSSLIVCLLSAHHDVAKEVGMFYVALCIQFYGR